MNGSYGDLIRALKRLNGIGDKEELRRVAGLLGFEWKERAEVVESRADPVPPRPVPQKPTDVTKDTTLADSPPEGFKASQPERLQSTPPELPGWLASARELPSAATETRPRNPIDPLLHKQWLRAILVSALSTLSDRGELDVERVIDYICANQSPAYLPLRLVRSMERGLDCWVDQGESMLPFRRDQDDLLAWLPLVVGHDRLSIQSFRGLPPPVTAEVRGRPVLLLSALGYTGGRRFSEDALSADWIEFARRTRLFGAGHVCALVPY